MKSKLNFIQRKNYQLQLFRLLIIFMLLLVGCISSNEEFESDDSSKNFIEKDLDKFISNRKDKGLLGDVRSTFEYEYTNESDGMILIQKNIAADDSFREIKNVLIIDSYSDRFNKEGELIKSVRSSNYKQDIDITEFFFDDEGKIIKYSQWYNDRKSNRQKLFIYDKNDRLVEVIDKGSYRDLISKYKYTYLQDTIILQDSTFRNGISTSTSKVKLNRNGDIFDKDPRVKKEYDKKGNLTRRTYFKNYERNKPIYITNYDFNDKNLLVKEVRYDSIGKIVFC